MPLKKPLHRVALVVILAVFVITLIPFFPPESALAYEAPCPIEKVTTDKEPGYPWEHFYIELTIRSDVEEKFVHGERAYSDTTWLPDATVKDWRVVPPTDPSIQQKNHWRIVISGADFVKYPLLGALYVSSPRSIAYLRCSVPDATRVAGYNTWLKLHRYVRKGEHGIKIVVPMRRKRNEGDPDEDSRIFFGQGSVFDVSQTEGEELPKIEVPELHGDFHEGQELYNSLVSFAERSGVSVRVATEDLGEGTMGYYAPSQKEIVLRPADPLTLAHEVAHHQLAEYFRRDDAAFSTGERESIAESVAYVTCSHFGLDTGARSFPYIALWSKDKQVLKNVLTTVQKISAGIIDGVEQGRNLEEDEAFRWEPSD